MRGALLVAGVLLLTGAADDGDAWVPMVQTLVGGVASFLGSRRGVTEARKDIAALQGSLNIHMAEERATEAHHNRTVPQ